MKLLDRLHMMHRFWRYRRRKEADEIRFMQSLDLSGKTALDIGANKGVYTYWLSKAVGPGGHVIAFEPQPELQHHLCDVAQTFHLNNIQLINTGLSNEQGETTLYRSKTGAGDASFIPEAGSQSVKVRKQTLDSFISNQNVKNIAYIKCDVEGHELEALEGAVQTIQKYRPVLQIECHHREALAGQLFELIETMGYDGFFFQNQQRYSYHTFEQLPYRKPETDHRNYLFTYSQPNAD